MNKKENNIITFSYPYKDLCDKISVTTLHYAKFDAGVNMATSLGEDETLFMQDNIREAADYLYSIFLKISPSEDCGYIEEDGVGVKFVISLENNGCVYSFDENCVDVIDMLCQKYLSNYVLLKWSEMLGLESYSQTLMQRGTIECETIERLLSKFLLYKQTTAYEIS